MSDTELNSDANKLADLTFHLLANCQEKEHRLADQHGLTQAEFRCLRYFGTSECLNNKHIAERMGLSPSRLTRIIDGLVTKRYMEREIEPNDRRNMRVTLSNRGVTLVKQLNLDYVHIHREILTEMEQPQHKTLITAMEHFLTALEKWIAKP